MEIEKDTKPGDVLVDALDLEDWVFEINVTPNRGDCLSVIGIARELAAVFGTKFKYPQYTLVEADTPARDRLSVEIVDRDACPRYAARVLEGVKTGKSPFLMRRRLFQAGVRAISNAVDVTNYVMLEYGQPLHAFDYSLIAGKGIVVRKAREGETFITLDSIERRLSADDLLICDKEKPVALAGVMGGENSGILESTTEIVLESAYFDPVSIRRTSKSLGLSTEASYRFERGIDPAVQAEVANRAAYLMQELAGARVLKGVIDVNYLDAGPRRITLRKSFMERVLGIGSIEDGDVEAILTGLGFGVSKSEVGWAVEVPALRHDVTREIDLVEEFIRIYGMDRVDPELPTFKPIESSSSRQGYDTLRTTLCAMGYAEVITYSFIPPRWAEFFGRDVLELLNPISDEMRIMRPSIIPGLAIAIARNKSLQTRDLSIFEIGTCFNPTGKGRLPEERTRLGAAITGLRGESHWSQKPQEVDFYDIKGLAEALLPGITARPSNHPFYRDGHQADILYGDRVAGHMGALHPGILAMLDIGEEIFALEMDVEALLKKSWKGLEEIPKFPMTRRDLSLVADEAVAYADIVAVIEGLKIRDLRKVTAVDLYTGEKLPRGKKGITIRLTYQSETRTLEDSIINKWQEKVVQSLGSELGIQLRQ